MKSGKDVRRMAGIKEKNKQIKKKNKGRIRIIRLLAVEIVTAEIVGDNKGFSYLWLFLGKIHPQLKITALLPHLLATAI